MSLIRLPKHYKETTISKPHAIANGLANAAQTATKFITDISGSGIWVTPDGAQPDEDGSVLPTTTGWHIADAIELFKSGASYFKVWVDSSITNVRVGLESGFNTIIQAGSFAIRYATDRLFSVTTDGNAVNIYMGGSTTPTGVNYTDAFVEAILAFLNDGCTVTNDIVYDSHGVATGYTVNAYGFVKDGAGRSFSSASYSDIGYLNSSFYLEPQLVPQSEIPAVPVSIDMGNVNVSADNGRMKVKGTASIQGDISATNLCEVNASRSLGTDGIGRAYRIGSLLIMTGMYSGCSIDHTGAPWVQVCTAFALPLNLPTNVTITTLGSFVDISGGGPSFYGDINGGGRMTISDPLHVAFEMQTNKVFSNRFVRFIGMAYIS